MVVFLLACVTRQHIVLETVVACPTAFASMRQIKVLGLLCCVSLQGVWAAWATSADVAGMVQNRMTCLWLAGPWAMHATSIPLETSV